MNPAYAQLAETIVSDLLLLEDRIDDLIKKYPQLRVDRATVEDWATFDPTPRKKYLPWIVKQISIGTIGGEDEEELDRTRDELMEFERLLTIPAFTGSRDIYHYDANTLAELVAQSIEIQSHSEIERKAKSAKKKSVADYGHKAGVKTISEAGDIKVLEVKDAESLSWWAWQAYKKENPNWGKETLEPPPPGTDPHTQDGKWCIRKPTYGANYLRNEPTKAFYLVLKNDWPYVGILLKQGQAKDLDNGGIDISVAQEIWPAMKPIVDAYKEKGFGLSGETRLFDNLRFASGDIQPGEKFDDHIDLAGINVAALPANLVFERGLDISRSHIKIVPAGTHVGYDLNMYHSAVEHIDQNVVIGGNLLASDSELKSVSNDLQVGGNFLANNTKITALPPNLKLKSLSLINTPIRELPPGLELTGELHIEGTFITEFPEDLKIGEDEVTWSAPMTIKAIKNLFYRKSLPEMRLKFDANPKVANISPTAVEKKWLAFKKELYDHFHKSKQVDDFVKHTFIEKEPPEKKGTE